jgi:hypothetical protein
MSCRGGGLGDGGGLGLGGGLGGGFGDGGGGLGSGGGGLGSGGGLGDGGADGTSGGDGGGGRFGHVTVNLALDPALVQCRLHLKYRVCPGLAASSSAAKTWTVPDTL